MSADSTHANLPVVVTTDWLSQRLKDSPSNLLIVEVSWTPNGGGYPKYFSKHIPGAVFYDLNRHLISTPLVPRTPPEAAHFQEYARHLGINKDTRLVFYERGENHSLPSFRAWWIFRLFGHKTVSVLDGGLRKWEHDGHKVESGEAPKRESGDFVSHPHPSLMASYEDVQDSVRSASRQIIDVREPVHFRGDAEEPNDHTVHACEATKQPLPTNMKKGHIPGSVNMPYDSVFRPDVQDKYLELKSLTELQNAFEGAGIDVKKPITTLCYTGNTASTWALAAYLLGNKTVAVYCGSWTEWAQRTDESGAITG